MKEVKDKCKHKNRIITNGWTEGVYMISKKHAIVVNEIYCKDCGIFLETTEHWGTKIKKEK